jgi:heme oxygenase
MRTIEFTRPSSIDEHVQLGEALVRELDNLWDLQEEKKESARNYSEMVKSKEAYIKVLQDNLSQHKITLKIECRVQKNYVRGEWVFFDPETGEEVYSEKFTDADWQMDFTEPDVEVISPKQLPGQKVLQLTEGDFSDAVIVE